MGANYSVAIGMSVKCPWNLSRTTIYNYIDQHWRVIFKMVHHEISKLIFIIGIPHHTNLFKAGTLFFL